MTSARKYRMNRGYKFEAEVMEGLSIAGYPAWKIPDSKGLGQMSVLKVPSDILITDGARIFTCEVKTTSLPSLPFKNLKLHQALWVSKVPAAAFFLIHFYAAKETYLLTASELCGALQGGRKSIPLSFFRERCIKLERRTARHHPDKKCAFVDFSDGMDLIKDRLLLEPPKILLPSEAYIHLDR